MADAADTVGDFIVKRMREWGVERIYGYPGDGINGVMAALERQQDEDGAIEFLQTRHEEMAALMACAHAKFSGEVGVCLATSGPGAIHLLNGLYDAKLDHQPVVAIIGQQKRTSLGADYQQEVDLVSLFKDVAHEFVHMATSADQVRHLIDRAFRIAKYERAVTCIVLPADVQELDAVQAPPREHGSVFTGAGATASAAVPPADALQAAADILNAGGKVAILAGAGALDAADELLEAAELLGAGIAKALLGKAVVPDGLPFVTGSIGVIGSKASFDMMNECDTLLMVGSTFPYAEFLPQEGQARGVQIDVDARKLSLRYPMECNLQGDTRATLRALLPLLERKTERAWRERIEQNVQNWWRVLESKAMQPADPRGAAQRDAAPVNPQRVFWELSARLPDQCIITCDSGSSAAWYAMDLKIRPGMKASLSGNLATMGSAVPYALAGKITHPDRPVIALAGDGAMQMNGINELITIAEHWREWADPRLIVVVLNNRDLNFVTWEMRGKGDRKFEDSQTLPGFAYADYARLLGLEGFRIENGDQAGAVLDQALRAGRPCVVEVIADADVPPMPAHITRKQAASYYEAIEKGDPDGEALRVAIDRQKS